MFDSHRAFFIKISFQFYSKLIFSSLEFIFNYLKLESYLLRILKYK